MGYVVFLVILVAIGFLVFHPALKGWRTNILGFITTAGLGLLPLLTQITESLQSLDWRQFVLSAGDHKNMLVLIMPTVLGILIIILRWMTSGPVGTKH
jgi:hypothetical protein